VSGIVVVTGACGALGQALLQALAQRAQLSDCDGPPVPIERVIGVDRAQAGHLFLDARVEYVRGDYEQPRFLARMMGTTTSSIFHLAPFEAGAAEGPGGLPPDLDTALRDSVDTTRALMEACAFQSLPPRLVVAGVTAPDSRAGELERAGAFVEIGELIVLEYARRGAVDGCCVHLHAPADEPTEDWLTAAAQQLIEAHDLPVGAAIGAPLAGGVATIAWDRPHRAALPKTT
jgi:hypothetical protein